MDINETELFITRYSKFYFSNDFSPEMKSYYGVPIGLHTTCKSAEKWIIDERIDCGIYDKYSLAWKAGKIYWDNGIKCKPCFEVANAYTNGYCKSIDKNAFVDYCNELEKCCSDYQLIDHKAWCLMFEKIYSDVYGIAPDNLGVVNIINSLFFVSKGKLPIYDQFVHKALLALIDKKVPCSIKLQTIPNKNEIRRIVDYYNNFLKLLETVFPMNVNKTDSEFPYINRSLDQALWVYGHINAMWDPNMKEFKLK